MRISQVTKEIPFRVYLQLPQKVISSLPTLSGLPCLYISLISFNVKSSRCTYQPSTFATQLYLKTIWVCLWRTQFIGVDHADGSAETDDSHNESAHEYTTPAGCEVVIVV